MAACLADNDVFEKRETFFIFIFIIVVPFEFDKLVSSIFIVVLSVFLYKS